MTQELLVKTIIHILTGLCAGLIISFGYWFSSKNQRFSKSFASTVIILPAIVSVLIYLIGSDLAKAVSIGGVFAFVRFRSVPGDSKDILFIFFAMAAGLAVGVNFYEVAFALTVIITLAFIILSVVFNKKDGCHNLALKITVPEDMNFKSVFDEVFEKYLDKYTLNNVRTTNMGTLFMLTYEIKMKKDADIKEFIDELRCRNGNLNIIMGNPATIDAPIL